MPELIAIAAMAENRVIGRDGGLPWHYSEDLKFFKRTTLGHPIVFGRTTYEGIGRPLPGRTNLVLSRKWEGEPGVEVVSSVQTLLSREEETLFICGGAEIYRQLFPYCSKLLLTRILHHVEGDTFLPRFEDRFEFQEIIESHEEFRIERWWSNRKAETG